MFRSLSLLPLLALSLSLSACADLGQLQAAQIAANDSHAIRSLICAALSTASGRGERPLSISRLPTI